MNCGVCGTELKPGVRFCTKCGTDLQQAGEPAQPYAGPRAGVPQPPPRNVAPAAPGHAVPQAPQAAHEPRFEFHEHAAKTNIIASLTPKSKRILYIILGAVALAVAAFVANYIITDGGRIRHAPNPYYDKKLGFKLTFPNKNWFVTVGETTRPEEAALFYRGRFGAGRPALRVFVSNPIYSMPPTFTKEQLDNFEQNTHAFGSQAEQWLDRYGYVYKQKNLEVVDGLCESTGVRISGEAKKIDESFDTQMVFGFSGNKQIVLWAVYKNNIAGDVEADIKSVASKMDCGGK